MSSPNPTQATVPLDDERRRQAADLWDRYVAEGMDPEEATRRVVAETGVQPGGGAAADTIGAALARHGGPTREAAEEAAAAGAFEPPREGAGVSGAIRSAAQGLTFGFGDEIEGGLRAIGALVPGGRSPREAFREGVEAARQDVETFRADHPVGSFAAEVGGGLLTGGAGALRSAGGAVLRTGGRSALRRALASQAARGAIEGAVSGAGAAEGGAGERALGAVGGGVLGGLTGGVIQGVGAIRGAAGRARSRVLRALDREGITDPAAAVRGLRPGETLMDLGETGGPVQRLARAAESIPSAGGARIRRTLEDRAEAAPTRIKETLQREARLTFEDAVATADELAAKRAAEAAPLYREAYQKAVSDDVVRGLFDEPEFQRAYRLAQRTAQQEVAARRALEAAGLPVPPDLMDAAPLPQLFQVGDDGRVEFITRSIPVRALDYMKSALQEVVDNEIAGGRLSKRGAMMLKRKLDAFLARVDDLVPEYAKARATFAGQSRIMEVFDAARNGSSELGLRKFLSEDPRKIERALAQMTPSEREFYRRGALDAVRERLESAADGRDLTRVIFGNTEMRRRIRSLFQSEADFLRFAEAMRRERRLAEGARFILGGSPTARIQADQADLLSETPASRAMAALDALLAPIEAGRRGVRAVGNRLAVGGGERTVDELAPFLTATGGEAAGAVADDLLEAARAEAIRNELLRALTGGLAIPAGLAAGRATDAGAR